ncbi:redoxin family protein [Candidatus Woesearchaeota archaeon]|nr:redoxin family protein [Candidatus Woesearchaeota archaeon]
MDKKRAITLGIALIAVIVLIFYFESLSAKPAISQLPESPIVNISQNQNLSAQDIVKIQEKSSQFPKAPELAGISGYLNTKPGTKISDFLGKNIVLVDFWTYTCINCIRTLPYLTSWDEKYRDKGLVIIGVHTPEFEFEKRYENVNMAIGKYGIKYPVVQDNDYATWAAFNNRYWPRKYLIDKDGFIRFDHIGEGAYLTTEKKIRELLAELGSDVSGIPLGAERGEKAILYRTPELYAGFGFALPRGQDVGNEDGLKPNSLVIYQLPPKLKKDAVYLEGPWTSLEDNLLSQGKASIALDFTAKSVNIVANAIGAPVEMDVFIDGNYVSAEQKGEDVLMKGKRSYVLINQPRLYKIIDGKYGNYVLKLSVPQENFTFHAFTFG